MIDPVEQVKILIADARKKSATKHTYDVVRKALHNLFDGIFRQEQFDDVEHELGYRDDEMHVKDEFLNLKFSRRRARLKGK